MNYGKKFLYIMISAFGMVVAITGIAYKTGYFPGHSNASGISLIIMGLVITYYGLSRLRRY